MEALTERFKKIGASMGVKKIEDQGMRKAFFKTLLVAFPGQSVEKFIKNFYLKKDILFLETTSKSFAQEIFLKQLIILRELNKQVGNTINKIRVM